MRSTVLVLFALLAGGCTSPPPSQPVACATPADADAAADVVITARDALLEPAPGVDFIAWTYDGDVPGPVLRMSVGDQRRVKLVNASPRATSLHFHGVAYANEDDGSLEHPASVVQPGCVHVYTITARVPGVFPYHSHTAADDVRLEVARGQYGAVVVADANEPPATHEFVVFLAAMGIEAAATPGGAGGEAGEAAGSPSFFQVINGRPNGAARLIEWDGSRYFASDGANATAKVGDRVRWRLLDLAPDDVHTFHLHGHRWCDRDGVAAPDGSCPAGTLPTDNVALAPAQGTTIEFVEDNPGQWMYHCHILDHVNDGMYAFYDALP